MPTITTLLGRLLQRARLGVGHNCDLNFTKRGASEHVTEYVISEYWWLLSQQEVKLSGWEDRSKYGAGEGCWARWRRQWQLGQI